MPEAQLHRETLRLYLERQGLRRTRQRDAIRDLFLSSGDHLTAEEIHQRLAADHPNVGLATIYRTLKLFVEAGIASERAFRDGLTRYEVRQPHHDHMICVGCDKIVEFENDAIEQLQEDVARAHGFSLTAHRHELYGHCPDCRSASATD